MKYKFVVKVINLNGISKISFSRGVRQIAHQLYFFSGPLSWQEKMLATKAPSH